MRTAKERRRRGRKRVCVEDGAGPRGRSHQVVGEVFGSSHGEHGEQRDDGNVPRYGGDDRDTLAPAAHANTQKVKDRNDVLTHDYCHLLVHIHPTYSEFLHIFRYCFPLRMFLGCDNCTRVNSS